MALFMLKRKELIIIASLKEIICTGVIRCLNKVYASEFVGKLTGNADTATGLSAEIANDKLPYRLQQYNGDVTSITNPDNAWEGSGFYYVANNSPFAKYHSNSDYMVITHQHTGGSWGAQIGLDFRTNHMMIRNNNSGIWSSWAEVLDSDNYTSYALPLSGGTMTGTLNIRYSGGNPSWNEGIRIHEFNNWTTITLCGSDNTGDTGTSANTWSIHNNNGNFYIARNGSDSSGSAILSCINNSWSINGNAIIHSGNIGSQSVNYANSAGSAPANGGTSTYANNVWTQSHNGSWYINSNWDGYNFVTNAKDIYGSTLPIWVNNSGYADSAGNASTATALTTSTGSATQPVYFSSGKPVACTYTLGKSVPSDAVFTDTNTWRPVTDNLTSTSTSNCLSANQGRVLKGLIDGKAASDHTHSNYLENGDYISCENSIVSIDGDLDVSGIVNIGQCAKVEESYVSCVKIITSGSKVTITIPRNNLGYSTALLDDVSIKCYLSGYAENYVDIYNNGPTTVAARWGNSSLNSYYPTIGCSYSSTTATITLTATFSTIRFLVIRYCPGLTTITVS